MRVTRVMAAMLCAAPVWAQRPIPVRTLAILATTDSGFLKVVRDVRQLPGGRVLVNDPSRHQLLMFDSTLRTFTVVLDTAGGTGSKYGALFATLIPFLGDSTLFLDREAKAFVVLDPSARTVRTMAAPRSSDVDDYITNSFFGWPGVDAKGRLIYRSMRPFPPSRGAERPAISYGPDSAPILRSDFEQRTIDTIGLIRTPVRKYVRAQFPDGSYSSTPAMNPLPSSDEWAVMSDGTVALVREYDYHIDWLLSDGTRATSPKMTFDWRRITLEEKQAIIDSAEKAHAAIVAKNPPPPLAVQRAQGQRVLPFVLVEAAELPDFYPPLRPGHVFADRDNNLWILPATSALAGTGLVWDVVNRKGEVFQRVRLPEGRDIAGFGPGGVVYLKYVVGEQTVLERTRVSSQ